MNKKEKTTLVPKLRFPEFVSNGPIALKNGNLIFEPISNKNHNSDLPVLAITQEYGAIPRDHIDYNVSVTDKSLASYKVVEIGDFIISLRSFQGGIEYSMFHGICSPAYIILRKKVNIVNQYYKHYFKTNRFIQDLNKDLEGIRDGKMISYSQFSSILLPKPDIKEQQKISDCLSSLEELIRAENEKLLALKNHKKGLMQKLFPSEGDTVPEWRFPEFRASGEWNKDLFVKLYCFKRTNSLSREKLNYQKGTIRNIHYGDIHTKFTTLFDIEKEIVPYINPDEPLGNIKDDAYCIEGDIIFADASENLEDVGKSIELINLNNEKILSGLHTLLARQTNDKLIIGFGGYLFKSGMIRKQIQKESQGTKVLSISAGRLSNIKVPFPNKKSEQKKIADCLFSVDDLISAQTQKVETLKIHKLGLMQGLFLSVQEVIE